MGLSTQQRLIGWPGAPVYSRQLALSRKGASGHWIAFTLIILFGAALRFAWLDHPALWGDEAATFGRVSGTFAELCDILRYDGFAPFHYELYWWLHTHFLMTPFMLRLVPAIAGTLMIPAMYFLGRLLTNRKAALWVALFTACSAWLLNYSRDAKMYSEFWLFGTLNYACLVWWFRRKTGIAWWCFVVTGIAMLGFDALGFMVIGVGLVWYISQRRVHWLSSLAYLLALAIIVTGPGVYYHYFNDWHRGELGWIGPTNYSQTSLEQVLNLFGSLIFKYQFHGEAVRYDGIQSAFATKLGAIAMGLVGVIVLVGALPWRSRVRPAVVLPVTPDEVHPQAWWRVLFWLLAAIVLPMYGWYCASTDDFATPVDWAQGLGQIMIGWWPWLIIGATVLAAVCMAMRDLAATLAVLLGVLVAVFIGAAFAQGGWADPGAILQSFAALIAQPWFLAGGGAVLIAILWYYSAPSGFIRARSVLGYLAAAVGIDFLVSAVLALAILGFRAAVRSGGFSPMELLHQWEALLLHPLVLLCSAVLPVLIGAYRGSVDLRWRVRQWVVFIAVILAMLVLCEGIAVAVRHPVQPLWVPRYLGMVWPPMAVGLILLIRRLPTRILRGAAFVLVLGLNLFSHGAHMLADTEPPVDKIVEDISAGQATPQHEHTILSLRQGNWGPGGGNMDSYVGEYYLDLDRKRRGQDFVSPQLFHDGAAGELYDFDADLSPGNIHQVLAKEPHLRELVVWTDDEMQGTPEGKDEILASLGAGWKLVHDNRWTARDHWSWKDYFMVRRRVYERTGK